MVAEQLHDQFDDNIDIPCRQWSQNAVYNYHQLRTEFDLDEYT